MIKRIEPILTVIIFILAVAVAKVGMVTAESGNATIKEAQPVIVIDAGHGGSDPGKVGVNQTQEKDLNLVIAKQLEAWLEKQHVTVVMTRTADEGPGAKHAVNKKLDDMRKRCSMIDAAKPDAVVSIHQNSFTDASVHGAQVFYFGQSAEGQKLADTIQQSLTSQIGAENSRDSKANESYYILKKTSAPTVIVECGFLSNASEEAVLNTEEYQKKIVEAVGKGVLHYIKQKSVVSPDQSEASVFKSKTV